MKQKIFQQLKDIQAVPTAHGAGLKQVFLGSSDSSTALTQFAFGKMMPGDTTGWHQHSSMEEYFYFIDGNGTCSIGSESFRIKSGSFIRIPAGALHHLTAVTELTFSYFAIAVAG